MPDRAASPSAPAPVRLNLVLAAALTAAHLVPPVALPLWLLPRDPAWGWLLAVPALLTPTLWALIHEAVHGSLHPDRAVNDRLGRWLSVLFGAPFQVLRLGHLLHHRHNRTPLNRSEVLPEAPTLRRRLDYYVRILCGLSLVEMASAPLALAPERFRKRLVAIAFGDEAPDGRSLLVHARKALLDEPGRSLMRRDGAAITLGLLAAALAFGPHAWMPVAAVLVRAFLVSFLDNAYHYANPLDDLRAGCDLRLPGPFRRLMLNFNLHATHHRRPTLPWSALPAAFAAEGRGYADDFLPAALRQLHGPLAEAELRAGLIPTRGGSAGGSAPARPLGSS